MSFRRQTEHTQQSGNKTTVARCCSFPFKGKVGMGMGFALRIYPSPPRPSPSPGALEEEGVKFSSRHLTCRRLNKLAQLVGSQSFLFMAFALLRNNPGFYPGNHSLGDHLFAALLPAHDPARGAPLHLAIPLQRTESADKALQIPLGRKPDGP